MDAAQEFRRVREVAYVLPPIKSARGSNGKWRVERLGLHGDTQESPNQVVRAICDVLRREKLRRLEKAGRV